MEEIPNNHLGWCSNPVNNRISPTVPTTGELATGFLVAIKSMTLTIELGFLFRNRTFKATTFFVSMGKRRIFYRQTWVALDLVGGVYIYIYYVF